MISGEIFKKVFEIILAVVFFSLIRVPVVNQVGNRLERQQRHRDKDKRFNGGRYRWIKLRTEPLPIEEFLDGFTIPPPNYSTRKDAYAKG